MKDHLQDLSTRQDVEKMVNTFYEKVNQDSLLAPVFNQVAEVDWPHHLPKMYDFWSSILLGDMRYKGNPFQKHIPLPIDPAHFERWLQLFTLNIDEHFSGPVAEEAKQRAASIAGIFRYKLHLIRGDA
jgi:hemoglobin